jgi:ribose 5-phosphate isomerase B
VTDLSNKYDPDDDYPDIAINLGEKVVANRALGVLICGSGAGVCAAVNKVKGVRASVAMNPKQAQKIKEDDDINVVCLSADFVNDEDNLEIAEKFLKAVFASEERFIRRVKKIDKYEAA